MSGIDHWRNVGLKLFQCSVKPDLDPDCLHINSLNISEEMLDAPLEIVVVFTTLIYMLMCML